MNKRAPIVLAMTLIGVTLLPGAAIVHAAPAGQPEIGAISRSTGHLFREGLAAGLASDRPAQPTLTANENGLITTSDQGAYAPSLWDGLSDSDFNTLIGALAPHPALPSTLAIARRLLLTDAPWPAGTEAQRLDKMITFGANTDAARLYGHLAPESPDAALLSAGARALIATGEPSVACLEVKANRGQVHQGNDKYIPERRDLTLFCDEILSRTDEPPAAAPSVKIFGPFIPDHTGQQQKDCLFSSPTPCIFPHRLAELIALGPVALASGSSLPGLSYAHLTSWELPEGMSATDAALLSRDAALPFGLRLKLYARSVAIEPPLPSPIPAAAPALKPGDADEIWGVLADLYRAQWQGAAKDAAARTKAILDLFPHLPPKIQILFVPTFESISPESGLTPTQNRRLVATLLRVDSPKVSAWLPRLYKNISADITAKDHDPALAAVLLLAQMRGNIVENTKIPFSFSQGKAQGQANLLKIFKNLSDLLDKPPQFIDNPPEVYEKSLTLTSAQPTTLPTQVLRNHLRVAQKDGQTGRMLLASLLLVQTQEPRDINPDVLADILKGLIAAGLKEEARQLATDILIEVTKTKGD